MCGRDTPFSSNLLSPKPFCTLGKKSKSFMLWKWNEKWDGAAEWDAAQGDATPAEPLTTPGSPIATNPIPPLTLSCSGQWHIGSSAGSRLLPWAGDRHFAHKQPCVTRTNKVSVNKALEKLRCCTLFHKVYSSSPLAPFNAIIALLNFSLFNVTQSVFFCYHLFN